MDYYSGYINQLIEQLSHLPGIGVKTDASTGPSSIRPAS